MYYRFHDCSDILWLVDNFNKVQLHDWQLSGSSTLIQILCYFIFIDSSEVFDRIADDAIFMDQCIRRRVSNND